jgi:drug/metabolite transporter (DMT)-like permease
MRSSRAGSTPDGEWRVNLKDQRKAYWFALMAVLCWATAAAAFKLSLQHLGTHSLVVYSSAVALLVLLVTAWLGGTLSELRQWRRADFLRSALLGVLNPFVYYVILFRAYELLPAQEAQPLNFIWPVVLVLLSALLFRQPLRLVSCIALLVSFSGVVVIATHGDPLGFRLSDPLGVALALSSTVVWALYWLYSSFDDREPVNRLLVNFAFGLVYVSCYSALTGNLEVPGLAGWMGSIYIGIMEMGLAFVCWLKALRYSRSTAEVGNLIYLTPFLSLLVIAAVVGERILPSTWIGLCLIVVGILIQNRLGNRPLAGKPEAAG